MKKTKLQNPQNRILIRLVDKKLGVEVDAQGNKWVTTKWYEVQEINLGSLAKPNKDVLELKIEPIEYEGQHKNFKAHFGDFRKAMGLDDNDED
jgi:hypothetical protein